MSKPLAFVKASDGSAATGMNVALYGQWVATKIGQPISFQVEQGAGVTGVWSAQGTNAEDPDYTATPDDMPSTLYWRSPTQPAGSAGQTSITTQATHEHTRLKYTPTTGGTGVVPVGTYGLGAGGVLVMPPDVANVPASNAAALAALAGSSSTLMALPAAVATKAEAAAMSTALAGKASIVDGLVSAAVLPAASGVAQGALSSADFSKLSGLAPGGWHDAQAIAMTAANPAITSFTVLDVTSPTAPSGTAWATDSTEPALTMTGGGSIAPISPVAFANFAAKGWAFAFRAKFPAKSSGHYASLCLGTGTDLLVVATSFDSFQPTHFDLIWHNGATFVDSESTITADTNWHTFLLVWTVGGSLVFSVDGVVGKTIASTNKFTDAVRGVGLFCDYAGFEVSHMLMGREP